MRVLVPPPRESKFHEVASATDAGRSARRREDTHAVFTLPGPGQAWPILVLAVGDGQGGRSSGRLASAIAMDTFGEALGKALATVAFESWTWQAQATDAIEFAVQRANAEVRALGADREPGREPATGLTAAILFGNWMAVVHLGRGRAWRLQRSELEQLTADRSAPTVLGLTPQVLPDVRFMRVEPGDVIAVASDGLYRYVDGGELAQWLTGRDGVAEILGDLLTAVADRGGDEATSLCLCRVRRLPEEGLPEPAPRPDRAIVSPDLPHFRAAPASRVRPMRVVFAIATILVAVGAIGGGLGWWNEAPRDDELAKGWVAQRQEGRLATVPAATSESIHVAPTAIPADTALAVIAPAVEPVRPPTATSPASSTVASADPVPAREDSLRRARRDSIRLENRRRDSADAVALAARAAEEQRFRDSVAGAMETLRREREAADERARSESAARAEAARQLAARQQAEQADRDQRLAHITAGRAAFGTWLLDIDRQSSAGNRAAPAIATGPESYQGFVASNKPVIEGARFATMDVNDSTGTATAEWTMKWRTEFGTSRERRVRARAEAVREGEAWRIRNWRILEGAP